MKALCSVGLDVGTTSTQFVVSRLTVENRASAFSVPEMVIGSREILYESPVYFTPLFDERTIDLPRLREIVEGEYRSAGITPAQVDTGAVIITGETARRENADAVLRELSHLGGEFVVATAGPDLESVLAAKGSGAVKISEETGKRVLHFDIGGGTANLALIEGGKIRQTACLNVGGRLIKIDEAGRITYVSPVLAGLTELVVGETARLESLKSLAGYLTRVLEAAAGLRPEFTIPESLITNRLPVITEPVTISFSGGVADCIAKALPPEKFGDLGPLLGESIRHSRLCAGDYFFGTATIRATVIGAGSYATTLSGSTVHYEGIPLPVKNLPAVVFTEEEQRLPPGELSGLICQRVRAWEEPVLLFFPGFRGSYGEVAALAAGITGAKLPAIAVAVEADMAKTLGQAITAESGESCLCIDGIRLRDGDYVDVGCPVGGALPVVIKTLILSQ